MERLPDVSHYSKGGYQSWDFCEDLHLDALEFNIVKYLVRTDRKGSPLDDLDKAANYCAKAAQSRSGDDNLLAFIKSQELAPWQVQALVFVITRRYDAARTIIIQEKAKRHEQSYAAIAHQLELPGQ